MNMGDLLGGIARETMGGGSRNAQSPGGGGDLGQMAGLVAGAFRSDSTPPAAQMIAGLFGQANGGQKAGILNALLAALGPALASGMLNHVLRNTPLAGLAALVGGGGAPQVTPAQADQVGPDTIQQLAEHATQTDPNVLDQLGGVVAGHPELLQSVLGGVLGSGGQRGGEGDSSGDALGGLLGGLLGGR